MEEIAVKIKLEIDRLHQQFEKNSEFNKLEKFYSEMRASGIAKKPEYSLPQLDTVGHTICRENAFEIESVEKENWRS
jgi:hypothetical protein